MIDVERIELRTDLQTKARLERAASRDNRSLANLIDYILQQWLDEHRAVTR